MTGLRDDSFVQRGASDAQLAREVRKGDEAAFESLVRRHLPAAHGLALSIVRDADVADDVCQDSFLTVLRRIDQLRDPEAFKGWLLSIVRSRALNAQAYEARRAGSSVEVLANEPGEGGPEREMEVKEMKRVVQGATEFLTGKQKNVFILHDLKGMDHGEIAASLGISRGASRVHLHLARRVLRTRLDRGFLEEA